jgi:UDP-N-acetylglucosamine 1-carboxyvinyltransferase
MTLPYPGFPTDLQPLFVAMMCYSNGITLINETVFENRYRYTSQLIRMGADIKIEGRTAIISGSKNLVGATVYAHDLRGGAALALAALRAEGISLIEDTQHIRRGYENFAGALQNVGADIKYIS